ncbi:hypothetical protein Hte_004385 [Hypoxylon texense]
MGGLLIKQALINAHNNPKYAPIKNAASGLAFFGTPHNGGDEMLVSVGGLAARIARTTGFQKGDNVIKVLKRGGMFSDIMKEHWRHQLLEYDVVSFWGASDNVVPRESARMSLYCNREIVVKLEADHRMVCKFGESQIEQDNLKLVLPKLQDLYRNALKNYDKRLPTHYIPLTRNKLFTGRHDILEKLKQDFFLKECRKFAVFGPGGVGKTQVALQFAHWVKDNQPEYSVFWMSTLSDGGFDQAYTELARRLPIRMKKYEDPIDSVQRYLSLETTGKWLLIVDNADSCDSFYGSSDKPGAFTEYLPRSNHGLILFTTRSRKVAVSAAGGNAIDLREMSSEEATSFLEKSLTQKQLPWNGMIAKELLRELACLPLAITQAAAYMNINRISVENYLGLLRGTEKSAVQLMSREFCDGNECPDSQNAVAATWLVSFNQIHKSDSAAAELLSFISYIEPKAIPQSLLPNRWLNEKIEAAIATLLNYAFLVRRDEENMFDMHQLVHAATSIWFRRLQMAKQTEITVPIRKQSEGKEVWFSKLITPLRAKPDNSVRYKPSGQTDPMRVVRHLAFVFVSSDLANHELWRQYLPHALRVLADSKECKIDERYDLFYYVGQCLYQERRFNEAAMALENTCTWKREHAYQDTRHQLRLEHWLASAYLKIGRTREAIRVLEYVLSAQKGTLAEEDHSWIISEHQLARAYLESKRIEDATKLLEHVVAVRKRRLTERDRDRLTSEYDLAGAYLQAKRVKEAITMLEHVVTVQTKMLEEDDIDRVSSQELLTRAYGMWIRNEWVD